LRQLKEALKTQDGADWENARRWVQDLEHALDTGEVKTKALLKSYQDLASHSEALFQAMDFSFLFNSQRKVFHIGYNLTTNTLDLNYYDLLASEARLASLVAIAKDEVPQSHWLHLGRPFTRIDGRQALLSWSATMFEYLMPRLMVRSEPGTLLGQTLEVVTDRQIEYGREKDIPWGISESGSSWCVLSPVFAAEFPESAEAVGASKAIQKGELIRLYRDQHTAPTPPHHGTGSVPHIPDRRAPTFRPGRA